MKLPQLTVEQVVQHHNLFREIRFRIVEDMTVEGKHYWKPNWLGYTDDARSAGRYSYEDVKGLLSPDVTLEVIGGGEESPINGRMLLPFNQVLYHRDKCLGKDACYWVVAFGAHHYYARTPIGTGITGKTVEACIVTPQIISDWGIVPKATLVDLHDQTLAKELAALPFKRCRLESVIGSTLIEALKVRPDHPVYRALVMAACKQMPPEELTTFEGIKDWVESNIEV
jgi:hypothetical protein